MNYFLEGILFWPGRARHALGFGLHSPYAFSMVTGTLRDTASGYYAYDALRGIATRHGRTECEARSLYRLLLHLRSLFPGAALSLAPSTTRFLSPSSFLSEIAFLAFPPEGALPSFHTIASAPVAAPPSVLLLADRFQGSPEKMAAEVRAALSASQSAFLLSGINRSPQARILRRLLLENPPEGMVFDGWHTLLAVSRRGLPRQKFSVLFPR